MTVTSLLSATLLPRHCIATTPVWANARSLATTCAIVVTFFSYGYLDVSVPRVRSMLGMVTASMPPGFPIRTSVNHRVFAPIRGFSQLITSFFASESHRHPPCALVHFRITFARFSQFNCLNFTLYIQHNATHSLAPPSSRTETAHDETT